MSDAKNTNEVAIQAIEHQIVWAKKCAKDYRERGETIPDHLIRKIENLKGAARALRAGWLIKRKLNNGETNEV